MYDLRTIKWMTAYVLVSITDDQLGRELAELREDEIRIGHESTLIIMLSRTPIIAAIDDVIGQIEQYHGPTSAVAFSTRPQASEAGLAAYAGGSAHGLQWQSIDDQPIELVIRTTWHDQDERSTYLAEQILAGKLADATEAERDLAVQWNAFAEEVSPDRPRLGIREEPFRVELRTYLDELTAQLEADGSPEGWKRLAEQRTLADGSVTVVENVSSDGGHYLKWYCLSRYQDDQELIERLHL